MAFEDGNSIDDLIRDLRAEPFGRDFFAAMRRLECAHDPGPRFGTSTTLADDPVRLGQEGTLDFSPSTISAVLSRKGERPERILVRFLGLLGPNGPLPLHITEYIRQRERNAHDPTLARFLDVFHHRYLSLFYRAWALNQATVSYDRPDQDRFKTYIGSLSGRGMESFQGRDEVPDEAKLHHVGHLANLTKHADGLRQIVEDYFGVKAALIQFVGEWFNLPEDSLCKVGKSRSTGLLGRTIIVGSTIWDCQQKFRLRLGAMGLRDYERFLPTGRSFPVLVDWVKNYAGLAYLWDCQLVLKKEEIPRAQLGGGTRLGWTSWLGGRPFEQDADNLVLRPPTV
jgi:type VI secretion system protein ImpH